MRVADCWQEYALLDCADGERLERWGEYLLIRPDPQVIWRGGRTHPLWRSAHARYLRSSAGGGQWERLRPMPEEFPLRYALPDGTALRFGLKLMGFKHTGLFPEQAANWELLAARIAKADKPLKALNLFAYTGGATLACLAAGAHVTHVDAAKGMVQRARDNAALSGLAQRPVRWIVEDCGKFAQRELRRGSRYDIILLDPPSYGRGPGGEVWKLTDELDGLIALCAQLLAPSGLLLLNSYSAELSPSVMQYLLGRVLIPTLGGHVTCGEIGLPVEATGLALPCGSTAIWIGEADR
ncbi:MAG: class I SAM-dependent methyltransferase [Oscillospiraceae bacterium]|jgi:23S rRNA (cytosine1962-C5)-methyltransferase|nr:class I SAM-dependent methyltransferase [Oscillospiraceae bacterium]